MGARDLRKSGDDQTDVPMGTVSIITDADGRVMGTGSSFEPCSAAGFGPRGNQANLASGRARMNMMRRVANGDVADAIQPYTLDRLFDDLREKGGYRETFVEVGPSEKE